MEKRYALRDTDLRNNPHTGRVKIQPQRNDIDYDAPAPRSRRTPKHEQATRKDKAATRKPRNARRKYNGPIGTGGNAQRPIPTGPANPHRPIPAPTGHTVRHIPATQWDTIAAKLAIAGAPAIVQRDFASAIAARCGIIAPADTIRVVLRDDYWRAIGHIRSGEVKKYQRYQRKTK